MPEAAALPLVLHPDLPPFAVHAFARPGGHTLHVEEWGSEEGIAACWLHGGPGSGFSPFLRRFFDPARYRVICIDQRGSGRSRPRGSIAANDTQALVDDIAQVRRRLGIARWLLGGGSWGATLALASALEAPEVVSALLLRAAFLARSQDVAAFFQGSPLADAHPQGLVRWLAATFAGGSAAQQAETAVAWWHWERAQTGAPPAAAPQGEALATIVDRYRVQSHFLAPGCWLQDPPLLTRCRSLPQVPTLILHGQEDRVCPPQGARLLAQALPQARLQWVEGAGHDPAHPGMAAAMRQALASFAESGYFA